MSGFDLGDEVDVLSYDFTTGPGGWDPANGPGKGTIGDPTRHQIRSFQRTLSNALHLPPGADQEQMTAALSKLDVEGQERLAEATVDALAGLCAGSPSRQEIATLSVRAFNAFTGYIYGVLFESNPTVQANATSGSLAVVRSA